jgi:predicted nucleic acid-binding protein
VFLLDTNVVSELRKARPHGAVLAWMKTVPENSLHLSAATFGELQAGAEKTRRTDPAKAAEIEQWIDMLSRLHRVLPIDAEIARERARLLVGRSMVLQEDAAIAATARIHGLTVVTRNVKDFKLLDVPYLNPFGG